MATEPMTPQDVVMCSVHTITGEEPCRRVGRWEWRPDPAKPEVVYLCNFHHEPFWKLGDN